MFYLHGKYWLVVDRILTDRPRKIDVLWHYHPDCTVAVEEGSAVSTDEGKGNLRILPISDIPWKVTIVKGQVEPDIQGWYSEKQRVKEPNSTVIYSVKTLTSTTFAWLLIPARGAVPRAKAQIVAEDESGVRIRVEMPGEKPVEITVPLKEGKPLYGDVGGSG